MYAWVMIRGHSVVSYIIIITPCNEANNDVVKSLPHAGSMLLQVCKTLPHAGSMLLQVYKTLPHAGRECFRISMSEADARLDE